MSILWNTAVRQYFCDILGFGILLSFPLMVYVIFRGVQMARGVPDPARPIRCHIWWTFSLVLWMAFLAEFFRPHDSGKVLWFFASQIGLEMDSDDVDSVSRAAWAWKWSVAAVHFPLAGAMAALYRHVQGDLKSCPPDRRPILR